MRWAFQSHSQYSMSHKPRAWTIHLIHQESFHSSHLTFRGFRANMPSSLALSIALCLSVAGSMSFAESMGFADSASCSGTSGPTCCRPGENCTDPGMSGCCQGNDLCGVNQTCYCGVNQTCLSCTIKGGACHSLASCCDGYTCGTLGTCCVGKDAYGCSGDEDCCSGLTCQRYHNVFRCH